MAAKKETLEGLRNERSQIRATLNETYSAIICHVQELLSESPIFRDSFWETCEDTIFAQFGEQILAYLQNDVDGDEFLDKIKTKFDLVTEDDLRDEIREELIGKLGR